MGSNPINDTLWNRILTLFLYRLSRNRFLRILRKQQERVIFVSSKLCIKSTAFTTLAEANAMQFVAQHTTIPVPKVHCAFTYHDRTYILMERIPGHPLSDGWVQRSEQSKAAVLEQLRAMVKQLCSIPPPENTGVANVDGGPIYDQRLPGKSTWGPFTTIRDFHRELRNGVEAEHIRDPDAHPGLRELVAFHDQPWPQPVFTHGDLSSFNIMVQGDRVVGIIDWETAGWMPPYWEYTSNWNANPQNMFWQQEVAKFVPPLQEALEMETVRRKYFGDF